MWPPVLADDVVTLRPLTESDREPVFDTLSSDREISRWTRIPWPYERTHLDQFFALVRGWHRERSDAAFAVTLGDGVDNNGNDGAFLGCIGAHRIGGAWRDRSSFLPDEPGYWLDQRVRGRGLMTNALGLVCDWMLDDLRRPQVNIQTKVGNAASRGVIERVGFRYTGTVLACDVDDDPMPVDHDRFVLTPHDRSRARADATRAR
jgi:RimJ/RimL family protein N-acetyltransferase